MASVHVSGLTHHYPTAFHPSIDHVSFDIADGEFFGVVGPSGSGKTTLLRLLSGAEPAAAGTIEIAGTDVTGRGPDARRVAHAFAHHRLYPRMTVAENLSFPLVLDGQSRDAARQRVEHVARRVGIEHELDVRPPQLAPGTLPFISAAQALLNDPDVLLIDDPGRGLEPDVGARTLESIRSIHEHLGLTAVFASSRLEDAKAVCDRIALISDGRITGVYSPGDLPADTASLRWDLASNDATV